MSQKTGVKLVYLRRIYHLYAPKKHCYVPCRLIYTTWNIESSDLSALIYGYVNF